MKRIENFKKVILKHIILSVFFTLCFLNCFSQNTFKKMMKYDVKGISINNKLICPINGFNHGTVDYGLYKQRGFYFAIRMDNAVLGESISIFETVSFESFDNAKIKGMDCVLEDIDKTKSETYKGRFWEAKESEMIYLTMTTKIEGKDATMTYIMLPSNSK